MESKSPSLIAIGAVVAIALLFIMNVMNNPHTQNAVNYLTTGNTSHVSSGDYHALARQDAIDNGIDPTLFTRQINQESGFNPRAVSPMGAIGIAQITPSTAAGWHVNPHDPVASLLAAAKAMAWYQGHYGSFDKALACYNAGTSALESAIARYGANWRVGLPLETRNYIMSIMGV